MQSLKRCTLSWPSWLRPSVASGTSLPASWRHTFSNDLLCAAKEEEPKATRESTTTIILIFALHVSALCRATEGIIDTSRLGRDVRYATEIKEIYICWSRPTPHGYREDCPNV